MHPAGQGSWRVGIESSSSLLDIALFTRDACGLDVPADAGVPPPVATTVPDRRDALAPALRSPAGVEWLSWWDAIVAQVGAVQLGSLVLPASTHQRLETLAALDQGLLDWPDLDALAPRPALREAVRAVGAEARRWSGEQRRKVALDTRAGDPSPIAHTAVRDAAEAAMTRYAVPPERVRAGIVVLDVEGHWWHMAAPGVLVCSIATASDEARIRPLLDEAFRGGLEALDTVVTPMMPRRPPRPPSVLPGPLRFEGSGGSGLVLEQVLPYPDGFELQLRRSAMASGQVAPPGSREGAPSARGSKTSPFGGADRFVGLQLGLGFADGRGIAVEDLSAPDQPTEVVLNRFWRDADDEDVLWLWVMPLPPEGPVTLRATWAASRIDGASVTFDGGPVRQAAR